MADAAFQILRIAAVMALLCLAAAIATPRGRLPLALRGIVRTLGRKLPERAAAGEPVPGWKRLAAFGLVLAAAALAMI